MDGLVSETGSSPNQTTLAEVRFRFLRVRNELRPHARRRRERDGERSGTILPDQAAARVRRDLRLCGARPTSPFASRVEHRPAVPDGRAPGFSCGCCSVLHWRFADRSRLGPRRWRPWRNCGHRVRCRCSCSATAGSTWARAEGSVGARRSSSRPFRRGSSFMWTGATARRGALRPWNCSRSDSDSSA